MTGNRFLGVYEMNPKYNVKSKITIYKRISDEINLEGIFDLIISGTKIII